MGISEVSAFKSITIYGDYWWVNMGANPLKVNGIFSVKGRLPFIHNRGGRTIFLCKIVFR
jgi:hypothetical protein